MERRQTSVIIEARPKVLLGAAVFIFYMGVRVGRSKDVHEAVVNAAVKRVNDAIYTNPQR